MKKITIIVTGSIDARNLDLYLERLKENFSVNLILTQKAKMFIDEFKLHCDKNITIYNDEVSLGKPGHLVVCQNTDILLIAPASYDYINKMSFGFADSLSLCTIASFDRSKTFVAPAMHKSMYEDELLHENIKRLEGFGTTFIDPEFSSDSQMRNIDDIITILKR